jgi:hypothetical protein
MLLKGDETKMRKLKEFKEDTKANFWVSMIGTIMIIVCTLTWLVVIVVSQNFVDAFALLPGVSSDTLALGNTQLIMGSAVIVIIDVGLMIWIAVSAFRKETQEFPSQGY